MAASCAPGLSWLLCLVVILAALTGHALAACGTTGQGCWAFDPCCSGYSCHPWYQKVRRHDVGKKKKTQRGGGRREGRLGAVRQQGVYTGVRFRWFQGLKLTQPRPPRLAGCDATLPQCYPHPRTVEGQPCSLGFPCQDVSSVRGCLTAPPVRPVRPGRATKVMARPGHELSHSLTVHSHNPPP